MTPRKATTLAAIAMAVIAASDVRAEEKPARLWMWGSVERPPPRVKPGQRVFFHGDREVSISEFVRIAGHAELADRMERRQLHRRLMLAGGVVVVFAGGAIAVTAAPCDGPGLQTECNEDRNARQHLGLVVSIGGMAVVAGAVMLFPNLRPAYHDLRKMEQEYNRRLQLAPVVGRSSAGVEARLRF